MKGQVAKGLAVRTHSVDPRANAANFTDVPRLVPWWLLETRLEVPLQLRPRAEAHITADVIAFKGVGFKVDRALRALSRGSRSIAR